MKLNKQTCGTPTTQLTTPYEAFDILGEVLGLGITLIDQNNTFQYANAAAKSSFQMPEEIFDYGAPYEGFLTHIADQGNLGDGETRDLVSAALERLDSIASKPPGYTLPIQTGDIASPDGVAAWRVLEGGYVLTLHQANPDFIDDQGLLDVAFNFANLGYWTFDLETKNLELSGYFHEHLTPEEIETAQSQGLSALLKESDRKDVWSKWHRGLRNGDETNLLFRVQMERHGIRELRNVTHYIRGANGDVKRAISFIRDETQSKREARLEAERESAKKIAREKTEFLARMTHEVRTPLNGIVGMVDALADTNGQAEQAQILSRLRSATRNLVATLNSTLDHAKLEAGETKLNLQAGAIRQICLDVANTWMSKAEQKGLFLKVKLQKDLPDSLKIDSYRLMQCLNNLISNALKFTQSGGITLTAKSVSDHDGRTELVVTVSDTGIGMSREQQSHLFKPFHQAHSGISETYGGSGLGMAIVKELVSLMNGKIKVSSNQNTGTSVCMIIPTVEATAPSGNADTNQTKLSGLNILVVDDVPINCEVLERFLKPRVNRVVSVSDGPQAIDAIALESFDIVLLDLFMPGMDGVETAQEIFKASSSEHAPEIIGISADTSATLERRCLQSGMKTLLPKPFERRALIDAILRVAPQTNSQSRQIA